MISHIIDLRAYGMQAYPVPGGVVIYRDQPIRSGNAPGTFVPMDTDTLVQWLKENAA